MKESEEPRDEGDGAITKGSAAQAQSPSRARGAGAICLRVAIKLSDGLVRAARSSINLYTKYKTIVITP